MTDATPAGWYPDNAGQQRWWDGAQWTDHAQETYAAGTTLRAPAGTVASTPQIWLMIALYLISVAASVFYTSTLDDLFGDRAAMNNPNPAAALMTPSYYFQLVVGLLVYATTIVLAYFDWKQLTRRGIPRPFHWAFSFISILVYVIGRSIVVRRRTGTGMAPMFAVLAIYVVGVVLTAAWVLDFLNQATPGLSG